MPFSPWYLPTPTKKIWEEERIINAIERNYGAWFIPPRLCVKLLAMKKRFFIFFCFQFNSDYIWRPRQRKCTQSVRGAQERGPQGVNASDETER